MPLRVLSFDTAERLATFATSGKNVTGVAIAFGGSGYTLNDILTVSTPALDSALLKVTSVALGVIDGVSVEKEGAYFANPTNPVTVSGGTGTGATFNLTLSTAMTQVDVGGINFKDGLWHLSYWV